MTELYKSVRLPESEWRVHVAALGFDELDRVITPLREMGADAFFLLQHPKGDRAAKALTEGGVNLQDELNKLDLFESAVWPVNLWNAADVAKVLGEKIKEGRFSRLHVNVSTGPKTVGIGATLASLFCPLSLYYADLDYDKPAPKGVWGRNVRAIQQIPTFRAKGLRPDALRVLQVLEGAGKRVRGRTLRDQLLDQEVIVQSKRKSKAKVDFTPQAVNSQFQSLLGPLKSQMLVEETEIGSTKYYELTAQGKATLRMVTVFDSSEESAD